MINYTNYQNNIADTTTKHAHLIFCLTSNESIVNSFIKWWEAEIARASDRDEMWI